jgi:hypothetical protein
MKMVILLMLIGLFANGCASYMVYEGSRQDLRKELIRIKAVDGGGEVGIDISALDVLKHRPLQQIGAALVDGSLVYLLSKSVEEDDGESIPSNVGGNVYTVTVGGHDNEVNINRNDNNEQNELARE